MNDDDLHRRLDDAFASRSPGVHHSPPDLDDLVGRGQQKTRRTLVAGSLGIIAIGAVGISVFASSGATAPDARSDALPPVDEGPTTIVAPGTPVWSCVGPLGASDDGAVAYYQSCTPADGSWSPYGPTTTVLAPDTTFACTTETFLPNEATTTIAYCGVPADAVATTTTSIQSGDLAPPCTVPGCVSEYVMQSGDYPLKLAEMFCVTVDELVAANGWDSVNELPYPGATIQLPPMASHCLPPATTAVGVSETTAPG